MQGLRRRGGGGGVALDVKSTDSDNALKGDLSNRFFPINN